MLEWLFSEPLAVGSLAPDFTADDEQGNQVTLSGLRGRNVVLIFYPGDDTLVCTASSVSFATVGMRRGIAIRWSSG